MRETIEFRIPADHADRFLEPGWGTMLGDSVRKVVLPLEDPRVRFIADWMRTRQLIGVRRGVLRPEEQLLISPRLYRLLLGQKARRFEVELAHWV